MQSVVVLNVIRLSVYEGAILCFGHEWGEIKNGERKSETLFCIQVCVVKSKSYGKT